MRNRFRSINVGLMLYSILRAYYSVDSSGNVNWFYKLLAAMVQPLVSTLATYEAQRAVNGLIAGSKFQVGQLANVLNYLYDNILNRIFITQGYYNQITDVVFGESPTHFDDVFANNPTVFEIVFGDPVSIVGAVIHVPADTNVSQITATVAQMALEGINYTIVTF